MTSVDLINPTDSIAPAAITAVILAGGRNSRMGGHHKALLLWRQRPFVAHIIERLQPQVAHIVINTQQAALFAEFGLPIIADPFAEQRGPLAGVLAGLSYSTTALTLFVPCDNPQLSTQLCARLGNALRDENVDIAYATTGADNHYLYVLMRTQCRASVQAFLQNGGAAVRQWYAQQRCRQVDFSDAATSFVNINSVADLAQLT